MNAPKDDITSTSTVELGMHLIGATHQVAAVFNLKNNPNGRPSISPPWELLPEFLYAQGDAISCLGSYGGSEAERTKAIRQTVGKVDGTANQILQAAGGFEEEANAVRRLPCAIKDPELVRAWLCILAWLEAENTSIAFNGRRLADFLRSTSISSVDENVGSLLSTLEICSKSGCDGVSTIEGFLSSDPRSKYQIQDFLEDYAQHRDLFHNALSRLNELCFAAVGSHD